MDPVFAMAESSSNNGGSPSVIDKYNRRSILRIEGLLPHDHIQFRM
jgi:hypothetical protein